MSFVMSELIIESVVREGLTAVRRDPKILEDIFKDLTSQPFLAKKYGERELNKIKKFFAEKDIAVVHGYHLVPANCPCISMQLVDNPEDISKAHLDDYEDNLQEEDDSDPTIAVNVVIDDYNAKSGKVSVNDVSDLSNVKRGNILVDGTGAEFKILAGVDDTDGSKQFYIGKNERPDISIPCTIRSAINFTQTEVRGIVESEKIVLGVHTKEPLLTKYLYQVLKYIVNSRKADLIKRGFDNSTYNGSDFTRDLEFRGDAVFNRFLTLTGMVQQSWRADQVVPIDAVDVIVKVERETASTDEAGRTGQTVQIQDE